MKRSWYGLSLSLALCVAAPAAAQSPPDEATKAAARTLAETGKTRFEAGDYAGAIEALRDAEKYFNAPTITRLRALAHEKLGQLLEAQAVQKQIADAPLAADAPLEFVAAQEEAKKAFTSLETRIPKVQVTLLHAPPSTRVSLDGKLLEGVALAQPQKLNPGKHTVVVEPPGAAKVTRDIDLKEQTTETVVIDLAPAPAPLVKPPASAAPGSSGPEGRSIVGPAIAFGVGGAGLIAGAIGGGLSFSVAGEVRKECGDGLVCPESSRDKVEQGKTFGYVSTVGFAVAGVGAALGVVLLVLPSKRAEPAKVGVALGPTFFGVKGAF